MRKHLTISIRAATGTIHGRSSASLLNILDQSRKAGTITKELRAQVFNRWMMNTRALETTEWESYEISCDFRDAMERRGTK
jgi:hypothetical protein